MDALGQITAEMDKADCSRTMPLPCCFDDCPPRETAGQRLDHLIRSMETKLIGLKMLRKMTAQVEVDSPLEQLLWELVGKIERNF